MQDNHSVSLEIGTLRGLHFQAPPHAQAKLVRCGNGAIFDVAVDIRKGKTNFWSLAGLRAFTEEWTSTLRTNWLCTWVRNFRAGQ